MELMSPPFRPSTTPRARPSPALASASPSQAASYIRHRQDRHRQAIALLDKAWAQKSVAGHRAAIESLDGMITYFVENRSMSF